MSSMKNSKLIYFIIIPVVTISILGIYLIKPKENKEMVNTTTSTTTDSTSTTTMTTTVVTTTSTTSTKVATTKGKETTTTVKKETVPVTTAYYKGDLKSYLDNANVVCVGDSVMLGAEANLKKKWPKGVVDAKVSRQISAANGILSDLKKKGKLGDIVVIHLGTNGDASESTKDKIMSTIGSNRIVFWINTSYSKRLSFNTKIQNYADKYSNLYIIDWYNISKDHPEYFYKDGIHLKTEGRKAYTVMLYDEIYKVLQKTNFVKTTTKTTTTSKASTTTSSTSTTTTTTTVPVEEEKTLSD